MDHFQYQDGQLFCEQVSINDLVDKTGSPVYVYSRKTFEQHYDAIARAFAELDPIICYSVKSCGNIHICRILADRGAGMDVVSGGELHRAQLAEVPMHKVVYAGVGKTDEEIVQAIEQGIGWFNIESESEFENIAAIARQLNKRVHAALRVNPDVDPKTAHEKTTTGKKESKFGVDIDRARRFFERFGNDASLKLSAIHLHIGSPVYSPQPYVDAIRKALELIDELREKGHQISVIDIGGGYGADYEADQTPSYEQYASDIVPLLKPFHDAGGTIIIEPGRTIAANAGVLIARVQYVKMGGMKKFVVIDSGMHHLIRPTLYDAFHFIWPARVAPMHLPDQRKRQMDLPGLEACDVVGPICESGDWLARDRMLPPLARGDLLCVFSAGAYGMVMASNYNATTRPVEVLVHGGNATVIRRRESYEDLVSLEKEPQRL